MTDRRSRAAACPLALLAVLLAVPRPAAGQPSRAERLARMDSIAGAPVREGRVAGVAVAVVHGADSLLLKAYGQADLEWDVPLTTDAIFEIGSVTKQFTAASVLKLRDEGRIDLDADITTYLPDYPTQGRRIPVRRLLDHTSGIRGYTEMESFGDIAVRHLPRDTLVARFAAEPFDFEPGTALIYNNSAYFLLGLIIEKVSGMSYEDYVEKNLFAELGMQRSSYCSNSEVVEQRAHGYQLSPGGLVRAPYLDHTWPFAAGSLCSTAGDLITWLRALHHGRVLPAASYHDMITPGTLNDGTPLRYAMGLVNTTDAGGRRVISHGGGIFGFLSETRWYPDEDLYVVVLLNTAGNVSPGALATELVDVVLPAAPLERRAFTGDASLLVGRYSGAARGRPTTVTIAQSDGELTIATGEGSPAPLSWVEDWTFRFGGQTVEFRREGDSGPATVLHLDAGTAHYVLHRES